ncbi:MAG: carboxypeptidase-like regulatory domain-containing protein [Pyrinomonadaceae bacterium]
MNTKRLVLFAALVLLIAVATRAQPGSDRNRFSPWNTCEFAHNESDKIFVGRVISVESIPNPYAPNVGSRWDKVQVAIELGLRGPLNGLVELYVHQGSGHPGPPQPNSLYIFTASHVSSERFTGLFSKRWSTPVGEISLEWQLAFERIQSILSGVPEPRVVGTVKEITGRFEYLSNRPLSGVSVVARDQTGNEFKSTTDGEGHFQFDELPTGKDPTKHHSEFMPETNFSELPSGTYAFSVVLPQKQAVHANGRLIEAGKGAYIQIGTSLCSKELNFVIEHAGRITGRIEREQGDWAFGQPLMYLYYVDPKTREAHSRDTALVPTKISLSQTDTGNAIDFSFEHVPIGVYALVISNIDPAGTADTIYYPTRDERPNESQLINVTAEKNTSVVIKLPSLPEREIFGDVSLPDGTRVNATVRLITGRDADYEPPADSLINADFSGKNEQQAKDGQFRFRYSQGRHVRIFAYFDTVRNGESVRHFGRSEKLVVDGNLGPWTIVLDHIAFRGQ